MISALIEQACFFGMWVLIGAVSCWLAWSFFTGDVAGDDDWQ